MCQIIFTEIIGRVKTNCTLKQRTRRRIKICYILSVLSLISISAMVSVSSTMTLVPVIPITILAAPRAILTGISFQFNSHHKKAEIEDLIDKQIQNKVRTGLHCFVQRRPNTGRI